MPLMEILVDGIHPRSLLCMACSLMLMPLMEILVDGIHPMSLLWSACSILLVPLMEILVDGIHPMSLLWRTCSLNVQFKTITSHLYHQQRTVVQGKLVARNIRPRVKNVRLADGGVIDAVPKRPHADADVRLNQPM